MPVLILHKIIVICREEHVSHSPDCFFVRFNEQDENRLTMEQFLKLIAFRKSNMTVSILHFFDLCVNNDEYFTL